MMSSVRWKRFWPRVDATSPTSRCRERRDAEGVTEGTSDITAEADNLEELGLSLIEMPGIVEAGMAAMTLNTFALDNCGFSTGGN
jgi:hypothetical protein